MAKSVRRKKIKWGNIIFSILAVLAVCLFPALFGYAQTVADSEFAAVAKPLLYSVCTGAGLFALLWLITRRVQQAAVTTSVTMLMLQNFALIESALHSVFERMRWWHCVFLVFIVVVHVAVIVHKKLNNEWAGYAVRIIAACFSLLILMNIGMAMPTIIDKVQTEQELKALQAENRAKLTETGELKPNVYYMIFDEYSGFNTIKKIFGYNNDQFAEDLEKLGFTVSRDSYNEDVDTNFITANLMNMEYSAAIGKNTQDELNVMRANSKFFSIFLERGYTIQGVGGAVYRYNLERADAAGSVKAARTASGDTLEQLLLRQTVIHPFVGVDYNARQLDILGSFEYLASVSETPDAGIFTMAHLGFPHEKFVFDANGGSVPVEKQTGWKDTSSYLNQYIYCTKKIKELVTTIIENDPTAIIILQSDHGARASSDKTLFMRLIPYQDMKNILNAVYIGGESFDEMQGHSGVNTLRLLANKLYGYDFEILEVPNGAEEHHRRVAGLDD